MCPALSAHPHTMQKKFSPRKRFPGGGIIPTVTMARTNTGVWLGSGCRRHHKQQQPVVERSDTTGPRPPMSRSHEGSQRASHGNEAPAGRHDGWHPFRVRVCGVCIPVVSLRSTTGCCSLHPFGIFGRWPASSVPEGYYPRRDTFPRTNAVPEGQLKVARRFIAGISTVLSVVP